MNFRLISPHLKEDLMIFGFRTKVKFKEMRNLLKGAAYMVNAD